MAEFKAILHQVLLYFLKVFAKFDYATEEDVAGFEAWVNAQ